MLCGTIWKVGGKDHRRVIHAIKVGLSLTLVTMLHMLEPFFEVFGPNAMWIVMTVVLELQFTAGTVLAGSLALFVDFIATKSRKMFQAMFFGTTVFLIGAAAAYLRFFPCVKNNYDSGIVIFLSTFTLIIASGYKENNVIKIVRDQFYFIAIGCATCLFMGILVFPVWSGEFLQNSIIDKLEGLAKSIQASVDEHFHDSSEIKENQEKRSLEDPIMAILDSKSNEGTLAFYARLEPRHSRLCNRFSWRQHMKLGDVLRQLGYTVVALRCCLQTEIQAPRSVRALFKDPCIRLSGEVTKVLMELANNIRNRRYCSPRILCDHLHEAVQDLDSVIKSLPRLFLDSNSNQATNMLAAARQTKPNAKHRRSRSAPEVIESVLRPELSETTITNPEFSEALSFASFAFLLVEIAGRLNNVIKEFEELGRIVCY
ncbi:hypothetical protein V6N13_130251 [Hibiscus sabdariffa]